MRVERTPLEGLLVLHPRIFRDDRGYFFEPFNVRAFTEATGVQVIFVQDNESRSEAGVLRGLHLQCAPHAQAKLVRVVAGAVLDVCVDIRPDSPTFGKHFSVRLDAEAKNMLYVPTGFAHGFRALENGTILSYKCSDYYAPAHERTIQWNDPDLGIDWGVQDPIMSDRDQQGLSFASRAWMN
ncbi:MAG TPA: dTDP-4-dehydrorhamnose 3,5-epimerase [Flavobacteriales bacterium]|jgi:dTDP-4-dehydrorhamnose 3,5-epimerase|nr:dTDP-4-dehydrorhamnose 3,5-epimerase [Flavobacteriales bacterium]